MSYMKTLFSRNLYPFLKSSLNPNKFLIINSFPKSLSNFFTTHIKNPADYPPNPQESTKNDKLGRNNKKQLDIVFKEALDLCEKDQTLLSFSDENGPNAELLKNLWDLEMEIKEYKASLPAKEQFVGNLKEVQRKDGGNVRVSVSKPENLVAHFGSEVKKGENLDGVGKKVVVYKDISQDMQLLLRHLYDNGYFKDVNFLPGNRFDMSCFYEDFARQYVKHALQRFGYDNHHISLWLSGSDAKTIALFGCPSLIRAEVTAAKKLRCFFKINEETVCSKCVLKDSCKVADKAAGGDNTTLRLDSLLRLLRTYSLEEISPQLELTEDMKASVSRLIHEVINLSKLKDVSDAHEGGVVDSTRWS